MIRTVGNHVRATAFVVAAAVACIVAIDPSEAADEAHVSGSVQAYSREPIAGASVVIRDGTGTALRATTDAQGRFTVVGDFDGNVTIDVSRSGFDGERRVCRANAGETVRAAFLLAPVELGESHGSLSRHDEIDPYARVDVTTSNADGVGRHVRYEETFRTCTHEPDTIDRYTIR